MRRLYVWAFLVLLSTYIVLTFTLPTNPEVLNKYNLTQTGARLLNLTVVVPIAVIYLSVLYGSIHVNKYAASIKKSKEGPHFKNLAKGLTVLAFSLPTLSIIGALSSYVKHRYPEFFSDATIVRGYLALVLTFAAIFFITKGARGLYSTLKKRPRGDASPFYIFAGPIILASIYTWLITKQTGVSSEQVYYLPEWLIVATIAIPYTFTWCIGAVAALTLYKYKSDVNGTVYKRAIDNLSKGVGFVIAISILVQFLTTISTQLERLNLTPLLALIYLLILLYAVGYGLIARGAKKLKQIEDV